MRAQLSIKNNFWRVRKAEAESNRGPYAYLPNALQLGQTCSLRIDRYIDWLIDRSIDRSIDRLINRSIDLSVGWLIDWSIDRSLARSIDWLIDWYIFNIALFSASEQTHCALLACDSKWMTVALHGVLNVHRSAVRTALLACRMTGATGLCCHLDARSVHTTQPCTSLQCYSKPQWLTWTVVLSACWVIWVFS